MYKSMDEFHKVEEEKPAKKWERETLYNNVSLQIKLIYNAKSKDIVDQWV